MTAALHIALLTMAAIGVYLFCLKPAVARDMGPRLVSAAVAMPMLAWMLPDIRLLYGVMLLWVPLVAGRFDRVVPVYLFSLLLLPGLDAPAMLGAIKLFDFGVHDALAIGAAAAIWLNPMKARPRASFDVAAIAVLLLLVAALSRGTTPTHFLRMAINILLDLGLPYYIASRGLRSTADFRALFVWLGAGAVTLAAILAYEVWKAWPIYNQLHAHYLIPIDLFVKSRGGFLRAAGPFLEPTSAAFVLAICTFSLWLARDRFRSTFHHFVPLAIAGIGLLAPQSRGAWMGLVLAVVVAMAYRGHYARLARLALIVAGASLALTVAARTSPTLSESIGLSGASSETSDYRRDLLARGLEEFPDSPLLGFSLPEITHRLEDMRQGEGIVDFVNAYLWILLISGVIGAGIFVGGYGYFVSRAVALRRWSAGDPDRSAASAFCTGALLMTAVMLAFTAFNVRPSFYVFALFGSVAALVAIREARETAAPPAPAPLPELVPVQNQWAWRSR